jgi:hypothetical protein
MDYAKTNTEFQAALAAYDPPEGLAEESAAAINTAKARASVVDQSAGVFNALRSAEGLDGESLALLVGAAYLISAGGWYGLGAAATEVLVTRGPELAALE